MKSPVKTFSVDVCRTGFGFATLDIEAENEFEAQQSALDAAGGIEYNEKSSEYTLCNPVPSPVEVARQAREPMEVIFPFGSSSLFGTDGPGGARLQMTGSTFDRVSVLSELVKLHGLNEVSFFPQSLDFLGAGRDPMDFCSEIVVSKDDFWLTVCGADEDVDACSPTLEIEAAREAFDAGANRLVVLPSGGGKAFLEDAGVFDDPRGIDGLCVIDGQMEISPRDLRRAYDDYRGAESRPRD